MSSKTLLATLRAVSGELGFSQPTVVLSSLVLTDIQFKQLAIAAGEELLDMHDWQSLVKQHSFLVTTGVNLYDLPVDYHRMVDLTAFVSDESLDGAPTTATWDRLVSGEKTFQVIGDKFQLYDAERFVGKYVSFKYVTSYFVIDGTTGLLKADFTLDSDKTVYHARLWSNFIKLKMLQAKNLDTRSVAVDFNASLEAAIGNDTPSKVLYFDSENRLVPNLPWEE